MASDPLTSVFSVVLAVGAVASAAGAWRVRVGRGAGGEAGAAVMVLVAATAALAAVAAVYRWLWVTGDLTGGWQPVASHVDGLLLLTLFTQAAALYLWLGPKLRGVAAGLLTAGGVLSVWAVCAATWTYHAFDLETLAPVWRGLHLLCVYAGTGAAAVAAAAGLAFLVRQHRLHSATGADLAALVTGGEGGGGADVAEAGPPTSGSLERLERLVRQTSVLGFTLLTLGLATGGVVWLESGHDADDRGTGWGKLALAAGAWAAYALAMNIRFTGGFRGQRAALTAVGGFMLLIGVYAIATRTPDLRDGSSLQETERGPRVDPTAGPEALGGHA